MSYINTKQVQLIICTCRTLKLIGQAKKEFFDDLFGNHKEDFTDTLVERKNLVGDIQKSRSANNNMPI